MASRLSTRNSCGDQSAPTIDCCRSAGIRAAAVSGVIIWQASAHIRCLEGLEHVPGLGPPGCDAKPRVLDPDTGFRRDFRPDIARAHGALPALAGLLAGHRDKPKIPDRGAVGCGIPLDDDHALAAPGRRERMRQPDDARADDGKIIILVQDCGGNDLASSNAKVRTNATPSRTTHAGHAPPWRPRVACQAVARGHKPAFA